MCVMAVLVFLLSDFRWLYNSISTHKLRPLAVWLCVRIEDISIFSVPCVLCVWLLCMRSGTAIKRRLSLLIWPGGLAYKTSVVLRYWVMLQFSYIACKRATVWRWNESADLSRFGFFMLRSPFLVSGRMVGLKVRWYYRTSFSSFERRT